jgi:hypothetical protein
MAHFQSSWNACHALRLNASRHNSHGDRVAVERTRDVKKRQGSKRKKKKNTAGREEEEEEATKQTKERWRP